MSHNKTDIVIKIYFVLGIRIVTNVQGLKKVYVQFNMYNSLKSGLGANFFLDDF